MTFAPRDRIFKPGNFVIKTCAVRGRSVVPPVVLDHAQAVNAVPE